MYSTVQWNIELPTRIEPVIFGIFPNLKWSGNKLVRNFVSRKKLVQKISVLGFSWSERTNSGMVKQQELWTNLSVSICNLLIVAMYVLDETFRGCCCLYNKFAQGVVMPVSHMCRTNHIAQECFANRLQPLYYFTSSGLRPPVSYMELKT